jgi:hypothetical protein
LTIGQFPTHVFGAMFRTIVAAADRQIVTIVNGDHREAIIKS